MRLPDFLIIGAMKAGTTSLYRDLLTNPRIYFPIDKEPQALTTPAVENGEGLRDYAELFDDARQDQVCGEASTGYTRLPETPGVAERARRVLGADTRIIYLVREPVARTISHHHHDFSAGRVAADVNHVVREHRTYIDTSRYAMQITPWVETFSRDDVRIVAFEEYISDRPGTVADLCRFLGVDPRPELVETDRAFNRAEDRRVLKGPFAAVQRSSMYRRMIRPWLPIGMKDRLRNMLLPRAKERPLPPTDETVEFILRSVRDDVERLRLLMNRPAPLWDESATRMRYRDPTAPGASDAA